MGGLGCIQLNNEVTFNHNQDLGPCTRKIVPRGTTDSYPGDEGYYTINFIEGVRVRSMEYPRIKASVSMSHQEKYTHQSPSLVARCFSRSPNSRRRAKRIRRSGQGEYDPSDPRSQRASVKSRLKPHSQREGVGIFRPSTSPQRSEIQNDN